MPAADVIPHFDRRPVQIMVALFASLALVWLVAAGPARELRNQHTDSTPIGEVAGSESVALIEVDLNRAEARELALLPGIGPVLANRIVANRDQLGPFDSVSDLGRVRGIGAKTLARIEPICFVEPSVAPLPSKSRATDRQATVSARPVDRHRQER